MTLPRVFYRNASNRENRKDRRYQNPMLEVMLEGVLFHTRDWSLGGMALDPIDLAPDDPALQTAATPAGNAPADGAPADGAASGPADDVLRVTGRLRVPEAADLGAGRFQARLLRVDPESGQVVLGFESLSEEAFTVMDRALARRLSGDRRAGESPPGGD